MVAEGVGLAKVPGRQRARLRQAGNQFFLGARLVINCRGLRQTGLLAASPRRVPEYL